MSPLLQFLLALALIILAAKVSGYVSTRMGQPAVLGELVIGLILGPTVLDMFHWNMFASQEGHLGEMFYDLAQLGVLLLMFMAGLEVELRAMRQAGRPAVLSGVLGVVAPVLLGMAALPPFGFTMQQATFMGLVLAATSVSISAQTLMELGVLRSKVGTALLGAAVVDDVLVILLLSLFTALFDESSSAFTVIFVLIRMAVFLLVAVWFGVRWFPRLGLLVDRLPISEGIMAFAIVITLLYAWTAEEVGGMAAITGAFLAGLLFGRTPLRHLIQPKMHTVAYGLLVPIFFVSIGLEANVRAVGLHGIPLTLLIVAVAIVSKVTGCGLGGLLGGLYRLDALRLGVGMISRGEVGLIVATVGLSSGLIGEDTFAIVVVMVLASTLLTPILLRLLYPKTAGLTAAPTAVQP